MYSTNHYEQTYKAEIDTNFKIACTNILPHLEPLLRKFRHELKESVFGCTPETFKSLQTQIQYLDYIESSINAITNKE